MFFEFSKFQNQLLPILHEIGSQKRETFQCNCVSSLPHDGRQFVSAKEEISSSHISRKDIYLSTDWYQVETTDKMKVEYENVPEQEEILESAEEISRK